MRRRCAALLAATLATVSLVAIGVTQAPAASAAADPCAAPANPIACENSKPGTPASTWDVAKNGDDTIQGFATDMSVNVGTTESFKVQTTAAYTLDIYRLGYYGGDGARLITSLTPTARTQPTCNTETATHLIDCGNWAVSASWAVPSTAVSGVYIAKITRTDTKGASHIPFVVRNDASTSALYFQTSDTTWQAYNNWGGDQFFNQGANFYGGPEYNSSNRAYKISYNRPLSTRGWENGRDYLFTAEYPMIRFMEQNGYDVSYSSGVDTDRYGSLLKNHKAFVTAGHDEYWSGAQRTNVEAARDAGVNMAFFSGNDAYWKTRYESSTASTDGSSKDYRTIVCYKDTWAQAQIDPTGTWTGTWRDPRFSPPADGGKPENALSGTIFMSNSTDLPITVNAEEGKLRLWRNTALANQSAGSSTALAPHTVGYESNEDIDNGFRPAGLIDMSTTVGPSESYLTDFGTATAKATTTHHLTLYKAASGALVFSAGSVQWAWGLDEYHDGDNTTNDSRIQQATVNLFADMGAQPQTLMSGLAAVSKSSDTTKPTSVITSPAAGDTIANGTKVTMTGTATDGGGGVVGGVEVSSDGGTTWHPATGRGSWTYSFIAHGSASVALKSRATDDSGNIESPSAGVTVTEKCPCTLYGSATPTLADAGDSSDVEVGVKFTPNTDGYVSGVRFYKSAANTGTHTGTLWSSSGTALATGTFSNETASGWQTLTFSSPVGVAGGDTYIASYRAPSGHYAADTLFYSALPFVAGPLTAPRSTVGNGNGVYAKGGSFPASTYHDENYYVDPVFSTENTAPPVLSSSSPRSKQSGVVTTSTVTAGFSIPVTGSTVKIEVKTDAGAAVAGATSYDSSTRKATFTPVDPLTVSTTYAVTVSGAVSTFGVAMTPATWTFTTDSSSVCPCSLFGSTSVPTGVDAGDRSAVEVGVKFSSTVNGYVTGVRFYKAAANTGSHTGTLWSSTGTALATGTFADETATGWQTLVFDAPVQITAGTLYTASYRAPAGHYSADSAFFNTSLTNGTLTAAAGSNGVYTYAAAGTMPTSTYGSANYWVDPLFEVTPTPPALGAVKPAKNATGVGIGTELTARFSVPVKAGSPQLTVKDNTGAAVDGAATLSADRTLIAFTPTAALATATTYTVTVSGATGSGGTQMTTTSWSFTTASAPACPCNLFGSATPAKADGGDGGAVELGVKVTPANSGQVTGIRFYKSAANTGTHTGTLWSPSGAVLATGTFTGETATGWQTLSFASPVSVTANTTYTASYYAPQGHYSADAQFFTTNFSNGSLVAPSGANGVYVYTRAGGVMPTSTYNSANYYVDVTFANPTTPPTVISSTPAADSTGISVGSNVTAAFSVPVQAGTPTLSLTGPAGAVTGTTTLNADGTRLTFVPDAVLKASTSYSVTVAGGVSASNVTMTSATWTFRTAAPATCPCSLFPSTATPAQLDTGEANPVELGVKFSPTADGYVNAVKFYKSEANTGTHTGTLWSSSGTALATGTFTDETASGWQTLTFANPVAVTAGSTYVASYLAPNGHFSRTVGFFASQYVQDPLVAPGAANGVYAYGAGGKLPSSTYNSTNYWVDVVFSTTLPVVVPTVTGITPAAGATDVAADVAPTATFSVDVDQAGITASVTPAGGAAVSSTVGYDPATRKATITPAAALASATAYTVSITARSTTGTPMDAPRTWTFTTRDTVAPTVVQTVPSAGTTGVPVGTTVEATFSEAVTASTVVITLKNPAGTAVAGSSTYDDATRTARFTPSAKLVDVTPYTAAVTGTDLAGNAMAAPKSWTFTTTDTTAPVVTATAAAAMGTSATVTWTTDEASTSVVQYGTSATSLGSTVTGPANVTAHSVSLTGLTTNTQYYYRVTSADAVGNAATSPAAADNPATFTPLANLAQGKTATQSSAGGAPASRAVDGNTDGAWSGNSLSHTDNDAQAWWQVDLGAVGTINTVRVFNRTDCCSDRLNNAVVFISPSDMSGKTYAALQSDTSVKKLSIGATAPASSFLDAGAFTGRYVKVQLPGTNYLHLAEVQVLGTLAPDTTPPVVTATAVAAATSAGTSATVTWTTDEASTSVVQYGTSATALNSTATGTAGVTAHSVALTGLSANAPYFYRVVSVDAAGNSATSPAASSAAATFTPLKNVAEGKTATQSSTAVSAPASRAVDGNTDGVFNNGSVTHTDGDATAWWQVDLGALNTINTVKVFNRTDCCSDRLNNAVVFISPSDMSGKTYAALQADSTVKKLSVGATAAASTTLDAAAFNGRYVKVQLPGTNNLSLAEVQVLGDKYVDTTAPVITATAVSGLTSSAGTTATVAWTTDEASTSVVQYGTSATALNSTATGASNVTAHSVALTGLSANAPYFYRVVSVDAAGNSATSPAASSAAATFTPLKNVAEGKTATQSSTASSAAAARAVDGNTDGVFANASVTQTNSEATAWWQVDLGALNTINTVKVFNRTDTGGEKLNNAVVFISPSDMSGKTYAALQADSSVKKLPVGATAAASTTLDAAAFAGRYVKVQLPGTNNLSLAEVQVLGDKFVDTTAPTITAVSAATTSAITATITWTTNEASTSVVQYGTAATSLTTTARGTAGVTAHSVALADLTAGTQYYYRVTSADDAGNSTTSPATASAAATFTLPGGATGNLARGDTVTASSSIESSPWARANVTDGVFTSTATSAGWTSNNTLTANHTEYVQVDLGSSQSVKQVSLFPRSDSGNVGAGFPVNLTVATSTNGITWTTVQTVTGAAQPTTAQHYGFTAQTARYVRITGSSLRPNAADGGRYRMQLAEIGVY